MRVRLPTTSGLSALEDVAVGCLGAELVEGCFALFHTERAARADELRLAGVGRLI